MVGEVPRCLTVKTAVHHDAQLVRDPPTRLLLISAPSLGVYYFLSLTLSVCPSVILSVRLSVCLSVTTIASSFLFLNGIETFLGHQFSMTKKTTTCCFSSFDLGPHTPKICSPKFTQNRL